MMKVALININTIKVPAVAPYSLDILGTSLECAGFEVRILDLTQYENPIEAIDNFFVESFEMVGIALRNTHHMTFPDFLTMEDKGSFLNSHYSLISRIKKWVSVDSIILGGVGFSCFPVELLNRFGLKNGVIGPGEKKIVEFAQKISRGDISHAKKHTIYDGRKDALLTEVSRTFINNKWYYLRGGMIPVRTTNGCTNNCGYCVEQNSKGRASFQDLTHGFIHEIKQLASMGVHDVFIADSEFNLNLSYSKTILRTILQNKFTSKLRFWSYWQPKPFDREYAQLLRETDFPGVRFGTDHTDNTILRRLNKFYDQKEIIEATQFCRQEGIQVMHDLLFGFPGDSPDRMKRAIELCLSLDTLVTGISIGVAVFPNTELGRYYEACKKDGNLSGFYAASDDITDPVFYVDPSFKVPEIFEELKTFIGNEAYRTLLPSLEYKGGINNQLVDSKRVAESISNGETGEFWYNYGMMNKKQGYK